MNFIFNNYKFSYLFFLILYFLGFYFREVSNGGAVIDLGHIWAVIQDLKINYLSTLKNYNSYNEGTFPFFHTMQAILNPYTKDIFSYRLSNTILNLFLVPMFIYFIRKRKYYIDNIVFYIPLLFLISPWFRSTSYWGTTENLAFFFLIPALFFFEKILNENQIKLFNLKHHLYLAALLTLATYCRQQYFFFSNKSFLNYNYSRKIK